MFSINQSFFYTKFEEVGHTFNAYGIIDRFPSSNFPFSLQGLNIALCFYLDDNEHLLSVDVKSLDDIQRQISLPEPVPRRNSQRPFCWRMVEIPSDYVIRRPGFLSCEILLNGKKAHTMTLEFFRLES